MASLLAHTYSTLVERALEPLRWDAETIPIVVDGLYSENAAAQSHVATLYHADLFTTILGMDYAERSLENAGELNLYRGTPYAVQVFAKTFGGDIEYTLSGDSIAYEITPPVTTAGYGDADYAFIGDALNKLTPFYLTPTVTHHTDRFNSEQFVGGGVQIEELVE